MSASRDDSRSLDEMSGSDHQAGRAMADLRAMAETLQEVRFTSQAGLYLVLTRSGAIYIIDLADPDAAPSVVRFAGSPNLLYDGVPLPGVMDLHFDVAIGRGSLTWQKPESAAPSTTGAVYVGTVRRTSAPVWIGRIRGLERVGLTNPIWDAMSLVQSTYLEEGEVANHLRVGVDRVREMFLDGGLAGANTGFEIVYPRWQFDDKDGILPGLRRVLRAALRRSNVDDLRTTMLRPTDELHGSSPRSWLLAGLPFAAVTAYLISLRYE